MADFKPMLAVEAGDLNNLTYPMLASPKLDGIRCMTLPGLGPVSRNLKPIPNAFVREKLTGDDLLNLDGELLVGSATDERAFNTTSSGIMSRDGRPAFVFWVFDDLSDPVLTAEQRLAELKDRLLPGFVRIVPQILVHGPDDVTAFEATCLAKGFEGVMLKAPGGRYKMGRSTQKESLLLKVKRFASIECEVVGFEEQYENANEAKTNALGYTERSSHKSGMVPKGVLGALVVKHPKFNGTFNVGTGFTAADRSYLWKTKDNLIGRLAKVKYFENGVVDLPRFPVYQGFRNAADM